MAESCSLCLSKNVPMVSFPCFPTHKICLKCEKSLKPKLCPFCREPYFCDSNEALKLAHSARKKYDNQGALKYFKIAFAIDNNCPSAYYIGAYYEEVKNYSGAVKYYEMADTYSALTRLGQIHDFYILNDNEALKYYLGAIQKNKKKKIEYILNIGSLYHNQDNYAEAEKYYLMALEDIDDYATAAYNLGLLYHDMDRMDDSIKYYKLAIDKEPNYSKAFIKLGDNYADIENFIDAEICYRLAIKKGSIDAMYNLGILLYGRDDDEEAIKYFMEYAKKISESPEEN